ncbi:MFS transporter [Alphaproteobacteria bacterium]|nr:MFS transporter [Alphaproteobacteria bacterium]
MFLASIKGRGLLAWGACALFFSYAFFMRTAVGAFQTPMMADFSLSALQFSFLSTSSFALVYGVMQVPAGMIIGRVGLRLALMIAMGTCLLSSLGLAWAETYAQTLIYRGVMGIGAAFSFVGLLVCVYEVIPQRHHGLFIGLAQFVGTMGPLLSAGPLNHCAATFCLDWRSVFMWLAVGGAIGFFFLFLWVKPQKKEAIKTETLPTFSVLWRVLCQGEVWLTAFFAACVYIAIEYLCENEGRQFLSLKGIGDLHSSYILTLGWLGYAIGCPLLGAYADWKKKQHFTMLLSACGALGALILILWASQALILSVAFILLGMSAGGQSVAFTRVTRLLSGESVAVGVGLTNAVITVVAIFNATLIGGLIDHFQKAFSGIALYRIAFLPLFVIAMGALLIALFLAKKPHRAIHKRP